MTVRYVGPGGNNANSGLTWALRKLTLNGVEDTPVVAGDTVYVGPGTYRELLTVDISGSAGNPITYIGDYTGVNTDGVGGVVRITGSDDDTTAARASCITATTKHYRTFQGFAFDLTSAIMVTLLTSCTDWTMMGCTLMHSGTFPIQCNGVSQARLTVQDCFLLPLRGSAGIQFTHTAPVDNSGHVVQNCFILGIQGTDTITIVRVGGITVKNCTLIAATRGIRVSTALTVGQTVTVNNCILHGFFEALSATVIGEIVENYNTFFGNATNRVNTATGANSISSPALFDPRWFFQLLYAGAGPYAMKQVVSPFDLASYSALLNVAGTAPPATDVRGTAVQGAAREWGPLEYDSTLKVAGGIHKGRIQAGS